MNKYGKFSAHSQADAEDKLRREAKRRLEQLESGRNGKKARHSDDEERFYEDEEEEERDAQYEEFHAYWENLHQRVATLDERLESEWVALKKRITALLNERRSLPATTPSTSDQSESEMRVERARNQGEINRLKKLQAKTEQRDLQREQAEMAAHKQAYAVRFGALHRAPQLMHSLRATLRDQQCRSLSDRDFRALTNSLDLSALFATVLSTSTSAVYYGVVEDYAVMLVGDSHFVLIRYNTLLK